MDRENLERLRLDVRLIGRRGWISQKDLDRELAALPDAADKIAVSGSFEPSGDGGTDPVV